MAKYQCDVCKEENLKDDEVKIVCKKCYINTQIFDKPIQEKVKVNMDPKDLKTIERIESSRPKEPSTEDYKDYTN